MPWPRVNKGKFKVNQFSELASDRYAREGGGRERDTAAAHRMGGNVSEICRPDGVVPPHDTGSSGAPRRN